MVRKRSWPAVSHCGASQQSALRENSLVSLGRGVTHDLQLHRLAVQLYRSDFLCNVQRRCEAQARTGRSTYEVDTDRGDVGLSVGVVGESQQQARLSHTGVSDKEQLEEIVVSGAGSVSDWLSRACASPRDGTRGVVGEMGETLEESLARLMPHFRGPRTGRQGGVPLGIHGGGGCRSVQEKVAGRKKRSAGRSRLGGVWRWIVAVVMVQRGGRNVVVQPAKEPSTSGNETRRLAWRRWRQLISHVQAFLQPTPGS